MINSIIALPTPYLVLGVIHCTTAIPAIEAALRAIFGVGELVHNGGLYLYTKWTFTPVNTFTTDPAYQRIGREFLQNIEDSIKNSILPESCNPDLLRPNDPTVTLRFGEETLPLDAAAFREYSGFYRSICEDFEDQENPVIEKAGNQEIVIPEGTTAATYNLLQLYLQNKSLFDDGSVSLDDLSKQELKDLYKLAGYFQMSDLEARCMHLIVPKIIASGATNLDDYRNLINLDRYGVEITKLIGEIHQFKEIYHKNQLDQRLSTLSDERWTIIYDIARNSLFALSLGFASIVPLYGPFYAHLILVSQYYGDHIPLTSMRVMHVIPEAIGPAIFPIASVAALVLVASL